LGLVFRPAPSTAAAARNTDYVCERYSQVIGTVIKPEGTYTVIQYGLIGNDAARFQNNDPGSKIGATFPFTNSPNALDCAKPNGDEGHDWCGADLENFWWDCNGTINYKGDFYTKQVFGGVPTKVYFGSAFQSPTLTENYETNAALVSADSGDPTRAAAGISTQKNYPFALVNDSGNILFNNKVVFCVGLAMISSHESCPFNALTSGVGGQPVAWAGNLNGGSPNSISNVNPFARRATWQDGSTPGTDLTTPPIQPAPPAPAVPAFIDPASSSFTLTMNGVNTQDPYYGCYLTYGVWSSGNPPPSDGCYKKDFPNTKIAALVTFFVPNTQAISANPNVTSVTLSPDNEGPTSATFNAGVTFNPAGKKFKATITRQFSILKNITNAVVPLPSPPATTGTFTTVVSFNGETTAIPLSAAVGDQICEVISVNPGSGNVDVDGNVYSAGPAKDSSRLCARIVAKPYVKIFGNDAAVGGKFADKTATTCTPGATDTGLNSAAFWAFDKKLSSGSGSSYSGSSSQFATVALGQNQFFSSAGNRNGQSQPNPPSGLSFGNMIATGSSGAYGPAPDYGGLYGTGRCIPNYFSAHSNAGADSRIGQVTINSVGSPASVPAGPNNVVFVDGNAYIGDNITFANSNGWASISAIPNYYLIVRGNIYIDKNVHALDGVYIAQPSSLGVGGNIYTCTDGFNLIAKSNLYSSCQNKLTITGSFIANQVRYLRTRGTVNNSTPNETSGSDNIAEIFDFSQEMYLAPQPAVLNSVNGGSSSSRYDSITSLPPIL
jgi:hypothetical protein